MALYLIKRDFPDLLTGPGMLRAFLCGGTDNKAAESLSMRLPTTKVTLMFILMQYVDFCDALGVRCHLSWRPHDTNVEADQITKFSVDGFDSNMRLPISWSELDLSVLLPLLKYGNFRCDLDQARMDGSAQAPSTGVRFEKSVWG